MDGIVNVVLFCYEFVCVSLFITGFGFTTVYFMSRGIFETVISVLISEFFSQNVCFLMYIITFVYCVYNLILFLEFELCNDQFVSSSYFRSKFSFVLTNIFCLFLVYYMVILFSYQLYFFIRIQEFLLGTFVFLLTSGVNETLNLMKVC